MEYISLDEHFCHNHYYFHYFMIQPENIFIKNNQYKLGDFGLVSKIENHDDVEEGDSRYMSMELLSGDLDDLTKVSIHDSCPFNIYPLIRLMLSTD